MTRADTTIDAGTAGIPAEAAAGRTAGIPAGRHAGFQPAVQHEKDIRNALAALAPLFTYPDASYGTHVENAQPSSSDLTTFAEEIAPLHFAELQSLYTSTFDLAPSCSPYLGIHLFGEEGRERARLMVGLRLDYRRGGDERDGELPDHIAEVLRFAPKFPDDVWADLASLVLVPALTKMYELLEHSGNPYRHLLAAVLAFSREWSLGHSVTESLGGPLQTEEPGNRGTEEPRADTTSKGGPA